MNDITFLAKQQNALNEYNKKANKSQTSSLVYCMQCGMYIAIENSELIDLNTSVCKECIVENKIREIINKFEEKAKLVHINYPEEYINATNICKELPECNKSLIIKLLKKINIEKKVNQTTCEANKDIQAIILSKKDRIESALLIYSSEKIEQNELFLRAINHI